MTDSIDLSKTTVIDSSVTTFRRLVTGESSSGKSFIVEDVVCPNVQAILGIPFFAATELWKTFETPVDLAGEVKDPAEGLPSLAPPPAGTAFRIVEFPPDSSVEAMLAQGSRAAVMHRTPSIDYAYVIDGEIYAVLDDAEALMKAGDVLIQRGTNHGWSNRSNRPCKVLFVLISAILKAL